MDGLGMKRVIRIVIKPSFTADQWGLTRTPEREEVAATLNATLKTAVNAGDASPQSILEAMTTVQARHGDVVDDSNARRLVTRVIHLVHGNG